jgi:acetolactate synthase-1/2/3 large subunit
MGFALPAALGAALLDRSRPAVALTGDAGLLMCLAELRTAAREGLNVLVVVFDDERLSLIDVKQRRRGYRDSGMALGRTDWCRVAEGLGVPGFAASTPGELERALEEASGASGPALVAARIDADAYGPILRAVRG